MLQNLEKEIDDVDAKIGDRWRLLDRYALASTLLFGNWVGVVVVATGRFSKVEVYDLV